MNAKKNIDKYGDIGDATTYSGFIKDAVRAVKRKLRAEGIKGYETVEITGDLMVRLLEGLKYAKGNTRQWYKLRAVRKYYARDYPKLTMRLKNTKFLVDLEEVPHIYLQKKDRREQDAESY